MRATTKTLILLAALALSGCGGSEPKLADKTYGIPNSKWAKMSDKEKYAAEQRYTREIRVVEQRKLNEALREQNEKQALARIEDRLINIERSQHARPVKIKPQPVTVPQDTFDEDSLLEE